MAVIAEHRSAVPIWQNRTIRNLFYQAVVLGLIAALAWFFVANTAANLAKRGIASGFDFLADTAGFDISFHLLDYSLRSTYGDALVIGIINTLLVSAIGVVLATIIGFVVGIARLSRNWLIAKLAAVYVDFLRNIPLLVQLIFWYFGVLSTLPGVRQSLECPRRGVPQPAWRVRALADLPAGLLDHPRRLPRRRGGRGRGQHLGAPAAGRDRAAVSVLPDRARPRRRAAARGRAAVRLPPRLVLPRAHRVQFHRRHADHARSSWRSRSGSRSTPPPSSPRSSAPAFSR